MNIRRSLAARLVLAQVTACWFAWLLLVAWTTLDAMRSSSGDLDRSLRLFAESLARASAGSSGPADLKTRMHEIERLYAEVAIDFFLPSPEYAAVYQVFDRNARVVLRSDAAPDKPMPADAVGFADWARNDGTWRVYVIDAANGMRVAVAESVRLRYKLFMSLMFTYVVLPLLVLLPLMVFPSVLAMRTGLKPLRRLASDLEARDPRDLSLLVATDRPAETGTLVEAINNLLLRIAALLERERVFLADAAHELRTPLAAVRAQAHALVHSQSDGERGAAVRHLEAGLERASSLVGQLLALARMSSELSVVAPQPVDLVSFCRDRLSALAPLALRRGIDFAMDAPAHASIVADPMLLTSVVDNLVDNAFRYCDPEGRVELRIEPSTLHGMAWQLMLLDEGPGISPQDRDRVFERFVRLDASGNESGSGLGLAIVRKAAGAIGAVVEVKDTPHGRGVAFLLHFPCGQRPQESAGAGYIAASTER